MKDDLNEKRVRVEEAFGEVDDWDIYQKVVGGPSHGRILGLGAGIKCKNVSLHLTKLVLSLYVWSRKKIMKE